MASGFDVGDTGAAGEFLDGEVVVFGDFIDNLLSGGGAELGGFVD